MFRSDSIDAANRDYQRQIAESLIGNMGLERAVHACQANGWDGVLEKVLRYTDTRTHCGGISRCMPSSDEIFGGANHKSQNFRANLGFEESHPKFGHPNWNVGFSG